MDDKSGKQANGLIGWGLIAAIGLIAAMGWLLFRGEWAQRSDTSVAMSSPETTALSGNHADELMPSDQIRPETTGKAVAESSEASSLVEHSFLSSEKSATGDQSTNHAAPVLDVVRIDSDGNTVIAGTAEPGSRVVLLVDDIEIDMEAPQVGSDGTFVSLLTLPVSGEPRVLTMRAEQAGRSTLSVDEIIIAPSRSEPDVAKAEPKTSQVQKNAEKASSTDEVQSIAATLPDTTTQSTFDDASKSIEATAAGPAPSVFRSGSDGVEVLQAPVTPETELSQVTLDTISYSTKGSVKLRGSARTGTVVRIYVDNKPISDLTTNKKGRFRGEIGAVEPGIYTLRLDEIDSSGGVLSRLETPFKREAPEALKPDATLSDDGSPVRAVTVQTGDTLWAISRERYGDGVLFVKVVNANRESIKDPNLIYPGQVFTMPD